MNLLRLTWKNLVFKPLSMLLSIILFALGVGLISLLFLLQHQLEDNFEKNLAGVDLVIGAKGSPLQLILSSMYHIDAPTGNISLGEVRPFLNPRHPLIERAIPLSLGDSYRTYRVVGTSPDILDMYSASIASGKIWEKNFEVVIGATVARSLRMKVGDTFSSTHGLQEDDNLGHEHTDFVVVGILESNGTVLDQLILTTNQTYWLTHEESPAEQPSSHETEEGHEGHDHANHEHETGIKPLLEEPAEQEITSLLIKFKGRNFQALNMQRSINENTDMQAATPAIEINRLYSLMDSGEKALRILAIVIILVSGLSIFISLFASLKERQYELALLRVMGGGPGTLFSLIICEGLVLAIIGCTLGLVLSHAGMQLFSTSLAENYGYDFSGWLFLKEELFLIAGSILLGLVAALIPAVKASRTDISETLLRE